MFFYKFYDSFVKFGFGYYYCSIGSYLNININIVNIVWIMDEYFNIFVWEYIYGLFFF